MKTDRFTVIIRSIAGIPIAFYGYALQKAWISIDSLSAGMVPGAVGPLPGGAATALLTFAIGILALKFDSHTFRRILLYCGLATQLLGAAALCLIAFADVRSPVLSLMLNLVNVGGIVLVSALWIDLYALLNPVRVAFLNAVTIIVAQAIIFAVEANGLERLVPILTTISLVSACLYVVGAKAGENEHPPAQMSKARMLFPYKAVIFIAVYSFAYGIASMGTSVVNARYSAVVPAIVVLVFVFLNTKRFSISLLLRMALPLMLAGFLLMSFIPGEVKVLSSIMLYSGFASMEMLLLLMVCTIAYSSGTSAIWLFGVLGGTQFLMRWLGVLFGGTLLASSDPTVATLVSTLAIVAVVIASIGLMSEKSLFSFWGAKKREGDAEGKEGASPSADDSLEIRVNTVSAAYSLTDRETEVLYLAAKGKTNNQIARDMFISIGTVKAHLYHIYQKLGIHTRADLMKMLSK